VYGEIRPALEGPSKRTLPLRMLFVHSDNAAVGRCLRQFEAARFRVSADVVAAPSHFVKRLDSKSYDLVIVEFPTPNWRGLGAQEILALRNIRIPLILLTRALQTEQVAKLITEGAADCVDSGHIGHLPIAIVERSERAACVRNAISRRKNFAIRKLATVLWLGT
jgi:FixJ family two-component response regulator